MDFICQKLKFILNHHLFCVRTSTIVSYLYCKNKYQQKISQKVCSTFVLGKVVQLCILVSITLRAQYVSFLLGDSQNTNNFTLYDRFPFHPLVVSALINFKFFNSSVFQCSALLIVFAISIDYTLYFGFDERALEAAYELIVQNGRYFTKLNKLKLNLNKHFTRQIQTFVKFITNNFSLVKFHQPVLQSYPTLSSKLRTKLVFISAFFEVSVESVNLIIGMIEIFIIIKDK